MDGLQDEVKQAQGASPQMNGGEGVSVGGGATPKVDDDIAKAREGYEVALKERDMREM